MSRPSPEALINHATGPFLEVGGPTQHFSEDPSVDFGKIDKPLIVSNYGPDLVREARWVSRIHPGISNYTSTERPTGLKRMLYRFGGEQPLQEDMEEVEHKLDLAADATALPIATGALGALYAHALPRGVEKSFMADEAPRTLEPGGILVAEAVKKESVEEGIPPYFEVIRKKKAGKGVLNLVLQRNNVPYPEPESQLKP